MMSHRKLLINSRFFSTSSKCDGALQNMYKAMKKNIIFDKDLNKRPSDLEIKEKNLPPNTPTLEHRLKRDAVHKFYTPDKKGGYLVPGKTGEWHDWIDEDLTLKGFITYPVYENRTNLCCLNIVLT